MRLGTELAEMFSMKTVVLAAVGLAGATLVAGPIAYFRTQRDPPKQQTIATVASAPVTVEPARPLDNSVRVTDELVRAQQVASPQQASTRPITPTPSRVRPMPSPPRKSLLARVVFGTRGYRPSPFPRPPS